MPQIGGAPDGLPPSAPYHASRPVSRVLYGAKQERTSRVTAIPLDRRLPGVSSNLPGRPIRTSIRGLLPVPPLFGLAPGGVCRAASVAGGAVRSCRTVSPLPRDFHPEAVYVFCGTFPGVTPAGRYPAPHVHGARTFLPGDLSVLAGTAVRPTDPLGMGNRRHKVKGRGHWRRSPPPAKNAGRSPSAPACRASSRRRCRRRQRGGNGAGTRRRRRGSGRQRIRSG